MVTPFLKKFNTSGGTLYVFPSASMDLTKTLVSNDYEFKFSHFACLNLPNIVSGKYEKNTSSKGLHLETLLNTNNPENQIEWSSDGMNNAITEQLQNYVMNFETAILNGEGDNDDYDNDILTTVSEKVFFNWLQKVGGISFDDETGTEKYDSISDRTIQYIGNIDVMNTVEINGDTFDELYLHIPSSVGASTYVYFRPGEATDNKNYLNKNYSLGKNSEWIIGRTGETSSEKSPYDLSKKSITDIDNGENVYVGDEGYTIDFRDTSYADGDGISTMNSESSEDFEFNVILIYYDFLVKTNTPNVRRKGTNLYGILFLDGVTDINAGSFSSSDIEQGYFQRYPKIKNTVYANGNSFALKIDLKVDTTPDTDSVVITYQDPNSTVSMALYEKAILQLQKSIDIFYEQKKAIVELRNRVSELETMVTGIDTVEELSGRIDWLYNLYDGTTDLDKQDILDLIEVLSKKLDTIMYGGKNIKLQYDTDVLQPGNGIIMDKSALNKVVISTDRRGYSIDKVYLEEDHHTEVSLDNPVDPSSASSKDCYLDLKSGENIAIVYIDDMGENSNAITVHVNDSDNAWTEGQSLQICFKPAGDDIELNFEETYGVEILTGDTTVTVPGTDLKGKTIIELIYTGGDDNFIYLTK